jgi:RND superfamily putative drug exporter
MTRTLARLADLSYRRRKRMVLVWIAATIVIIGVGSSLAGEYHADYNTPGSESKAASELTEQRFAGYTGQEVYVVWKSSDGADSPAVQERVDAFLAAAQRVEHVSEPTATRVSRDGTIGATTLPLTIDGWEVPREDGEKLISPPPSPTAATGSRSSSAAIRSTAPRRPRRPSSTGSSAARSCC